MLCRQDGSQACRDSGQSDHRGVTWTWLVGDRAGRLFNVFVGFEPLPQKEVRAGRQAGRVLGWGDEVHLPSQWLETRWGPPRLDVNSLPSPLLAPRPHPQPQAPA